MTTRIATIIITRGAQFPSDVVGGLTMNDVYRVASHIDPTARALITDDQPRHGRVVVTWIADDEITDFQCDGWLDGGLLFLPFDGQSPLGSNFDERGQPEGAWYEASSGRTAVLGLAGAPLSILA